MEATFQEVRQRLGFETQRQWSEKAIRRTAPALLGLFSLVTLFAHRQMAQEGSRTIRQAAWYDKSRPTFTEMRWRWYARSCGLAPLFSSHSRSPTR
jgi:hypothetical protein